MGVTIRRGKLPTDNFTIIPNDYLRDDRLSWEARGLLAWLMSHTVSYQVTEEGIISAGSMRRDGVRRMVRELETCGYLRRDKTFTPGVGTTVDYVLLAPYDGETVVSDDGETVVRPDQGQQDLFAGQPYDGETVVLPYKENQKKNKTPSVSRRGTRIPDNFEPTDEMKTWFKEQGYTDIINGPHEHAQFVDYWMAKAGADACKLDWPATWRRWMRTAAARAPRRPGNSVAPTSGAPVHYKPSTTDQRVSQALALAAKYEEQGL